MSTRKSTLSPESRAVIDDLCAHGPSTVRELLQRLRGPVCENLPKRMRNLVDLGWIEPRWDMHGNQKWAACPRPPHRLKPEPQATPEPRTLQPFAVAAPRQVQVMKSPAWVPPASSVARPGAMDFKSCASRGHAC